MWQVPKRAAYPAEEIDWENALHEPVSFPLDLREAKLYFLRQSLTKYVS